ncbi:hypothetical protein FHS10_004484 [Mucilaginibacter dorajii]|nr:hypothetical protein [Mucilaginibacter dorajii]
MEDERVYYIFPIKKNVISNETVGGLCIRGEEKSYTSDKQRWLLYKISHPCHPTPHPSRIRNDSVVLW